LNHEDHEGHEEEKNLFGLDHGYRRRNAFLQLNLESFQK